MAKRIREKANARKANADKRPHATAKYVRISSSKVKIVADLIRGKSAEEALAILMYTPKAAAPVMEKLLLFFLSGAFWACVGMLFAALTGSKYMAYASPFIIYYVLIILCERYFTFLYVLYPKEWTAPSEGWMWGTGGVVIMLLELTVIVSAVFSIAAKRRLARL